MDKPLVSIITPCYNSEKWVARYLDSLTNQTYGNIELIIVNDGSTDRTEEIILPYESCLKEAGIRLVYIYQENKGLGGAIQTGLKMVAGEYFCWCDSDNFYTNDYVAAKVEFFLNNPQYSIVRCDGYIVYEPDIYKPAGLMSEGNKDKYNPKLFLNALEIKDFHFGCAMLKTADFDKINPERKIYPSREGQNWQFMLPMTYHFKSGYIDRPMFYFVYRSDSISHVASMRGIADTVKQHEEYILIIKNTLESMNMEPVCRDKYLRLVENRYARSNMSLAFLYKDKALSKEQYLILKKNRNANFKDRIQHYRTISGFFNALTSVYIFPLNMLRKLKRNTK